MRSATKYLFLVKYLLALELVLFLLMAAFGSGDRQLHKMVYDNLSGIYEPAYLRRSESASTNMIIDERSSTEECSAELVRVDDVTDTKHICQNNSPLTHKIPFVIYQKSNSRCVHSEYARIMDVWRNLTGFSYRLFDDQAVLDFLEQNTDLDEEFPLLRSIQACLETRKTGIADLWRYLILYKYGGIYTDMDTVPNGLDEHTIQPEDDAFFLLTNLRLPSQHFMAVRPKHPVMYYLIQHTIYRVLSVNKVNVFNPADITGPNAVKAAFMTFMESSDDHKMRGHVYTYRNFTQGVYHGKNGATVRIAGEAGLWDIVAHPPHAPAFTEKKKIQLYNSMNMTHFTDVQSSFRRSGNKGMSCPTTMYYKMGLDHETSNGQQLVLPKRDSKPVKELRNGIPLLIHHYSWEERHDQESSFCSEKAKGFLSSFDCLDSGYEETMKALFNENTFPNIKSVLENCAKLDPFVTSMIARFFLLWKHGGVFVENGVKLGDNIDADLQSIWNGTENTVFFSDEKGLVTTQIMGSQPKSPFVFYILQTLLLSVARSDPLPSSENQEGMFTSFQEMLDPKALSKIISDSISLVRQDVDKKPEAPKVVLHPIKTWKHVFEIPIAQVSSNATSSNSTPMWEITSDARLFDGFVRPSCFQAILDSETKPTGIVSIMS